MVGSHTDPDTSSNSGRHHFEEHDPHYGYADDLYGDQRDPYYGDPHRGGHTGVHPGRSRDELHDDHWPDHQDGVAAEGVCEAGDALGDAQNAGQKLFRAAPYVLTGGRTRPSTPLDMLSLVRGTGRSRPEQLSVTHGRALAVCHKPVSVAEVAAHIGQPLNVAKILLSDLIEIGAVIAKYPPPDTAYVNDPAILEAVLDGLRNLK